LRIELDAPLGHRKPPERPLGPPSRQDRQLRNLALALHLQHLLDTGQVRNQAEIARLCGISRARVSQLMELSMILPQHRLPELSRDSLLATPSSFRSSIPTTPTI
jgi:hypothetical protein